METVFDSAELPVHDRIEAWVATTALALVTTEIRPLDPAAFTARLRSMSLGAAQLTEMSYAPLVSQRTPALIRQSDPEHYQVALVRSGHQGIEQARTRSLLGPGDLVLYDSSRPFDAMVDGSRAEATAESLLLQFPKRLLPLPESRIAGLLAVRLPGTEGIGRLCAQFMTALAEEHTRCTPRDTARLGHTALGLVTAVLAHHLDDETTAPAQSQPQVLFLRVTSFIDRHLHAPDLGPATVASAHRISLRYLHRIFQQHGTSVRTYIRQQRLDRCRRDLADPHLRHLTVHAIAARWGFSRPADFSRAFRTAVGMPPSDYRALAQPGPTPPACR
ncbi:AraC-like ligand-binding domain-containing protein [Streptomyces chattanoogensis]|uniref:AraC-like ligand-binding domain-containing protein n=1 Tax=Streptomyces chattanoogensis TaxID=66876 RepID=UPI0036A47C75